MPQIDSNTSSLAAPLWRRLSAAFYDYLLVGAIWFASAGICVSAFNNFFPAQLINDHGIGTLPSWFLHGLLMPLLLFEAWAFYAWFWVHGGQTLGMRSWQIGVRDFHGRPIALWQTLVRFVGAWLSALSMGAGYWLVLIKPHQSLHDRLSATETRIVSKHH